MAPNFPGPYYTQINYHGLLAPHTMQLSNKGWNPGGTFGTFDIWSGGTIAANTMIVDLVTSMLPNFDGGTVFDNFTIFKQLLPADVPQPVVGGAFTGLSGTDTGGSWSSAVETIIIARSTTFGLAKMVLLDSISEDDFSPLLVAPTRIVNLLNEWGSDAKGWCARDNGQIVTFLKATRNLNQKLRKEYRYT